MVVQLEFRNELLSTDLSNHPVQIIGQVKHLNLLKYSQISCKVSPYVTEETFNAAIARLQPTPTDSTFLYLNSANIAALPLKCSRHNTPSRAHAISKLVKKGPVTTNGSVVVVCEKRELYASACAVVRAFPTYSKKTKGVTGLSRSKKDSKPSSNSTAGTVVNIEFIILNSIDGGDGNHPVDLTTDDKLTSNDLDLLRNSAYGIRLTAEIVDKPCNEMNVDHFLKEIHTVGQLLNIKPVVIRGEELKEKGFGGIYGVGAAANCPPALAILSHTPPGAHKTIAWVGKGIVYDTGGLSIKKTADMVGMKRDCGGAAGILGAFYNVVKSQFNQNLHAIFCLAENSVGPKATRPDDVHTLYSGLTAEINNTDAEGRLVLADGVAYAKKDLNADIILDMATLTGAQGISTGRYHGAILTNNESWEKCALDAGKYSGDLLFPIPFCPELHFSEYASVIADMKNSVADRHNAQASCAGLFMLAHLGFDFPGTWIHVDMAYPCDFGDRATGYGVALLSTLFGTYTNQGLLTDAANQFSKWGDENPTKKARIEAHS